MLSSNTHEVANMADTSNIVLLSQDQLRQAACSNLYPKTYPVLITKSFWAVFLSGTAAAVLVIIAGPILILELAVGDVIGRLESNYWVFPFVFSIFYVFFVLVSIVGFIPRTVERTEDSLNLYFPLQTIRIPIDCIEEVVVVSVCGCSDSWKFGKKYAFKKILWGTPSSFDKMVVVITNTCCRNYQFTLENTTEFVENNSPECELHQPVGAVSTEMVESGYSPPAIITVNAL